MGGKIPDSFKANNILRLISDIMSVFLTGIIRFVLFSNSWTIFQLVYSSWPRFERCFKGSLPYKLQARKQVWWRIPSGFSLHTVWNWHSQDFRLSRNMVFHKLHEHTMNWVLNWCGIFKENGSLQYDDPCTCFLHFSLSVKGRSEGPFAAPLPL